MRRIATIVAVVGLCGPAAAGEKPPEFDPHLPPCVVATVPDSRACDVDFTLRQVRVTFDRPMTVGENYSWIILQNHGVYPGIRGGGGMPHWEEDGRTCVLPVRLSPDTVYAVGINSYRHAGFHDREGKVAVPFALIFKTRKAKPAKGEL